MKIIVSTGHAFSGHGLAHQALAAVGVAEALASRREGLAPKAISQKLLKAYGVSPADGGAVHQIKPGKLWDELATDLFLANLEQDAWGWADADAVCMLEWLKDFDPQVRFVLAYAAPEFVLGQMLMNTAADQDSIDRAITSWIVANNEILRFYHRNPDRCLLVNSLAAVHAPAQLAEKASSHFGIKLGALDGAFQVDRAGVSAIASTLAQAFIENCHDAIALYQELKASADLDIAATAGLEAEKRHAWQEYVLLLENVERAENAARASAAQLMALEQDSARAISERQRQAEELAKSLEDQKTVARDLQVQLGQVVKVRDEQAAGAAELRRQLEAKIAENAELKREPRQTAKEAELAQENELLLLQLHQVQEELEHYFLEYQKLSGQGRQGAESVAPQRQSWNISQPTEVAFDLRREFDGDNWYYAEHDGRWAGPGDTSTIRLPALAPGNYELKLDVVDAMEPEILAGMDVSINGVVVAITSEWQGYPALVQGTFSTEGMAERTIWELRFKFPKLVSPAEHGSDDERNLAIRASSIRLCALG